MGSSVSITEKKHILTSHVKNDCAELQSNYVGDISRQCVTFQDIPISDFESSGLEIASSCDFLYQNLSSVDEASNVRNSEREEHYSGCSSLRRRISRLGCKV